MAVDVRWQQRFGNYCRALEHLECFLEPPALNEREQLGLIDEGEAWMLMIQDRNLTSHTYNRAMADAIASQIVSVYLPCYQALRSRLHQRLLQEREATSAELHCLPRLSSRVSRKLSNSGCCSCSVSTPMLKRCGCSAPGPWAGIGPVPISTSALKVSSSRTAIASS